MVLAERALQYSQALSVQLFRLLVPLPLVAYAGKDREAGARLGVGGTEGLEEGQQVSASERRSILIYTKTK